MADCRTVAVAAIGCGAVFAVAVGLAGGPQGRAGALVLLVGAAVATVLAFVRAGFPRLVGHRSGEPPPVLDDPGDRAVLAEAAEHVRVIVRIWPALGPLGGPADPGGLLDETMRDLRAVLVERQELRQVHRRLRLAVPPQSPSVRAELDNRRLLVAERIRESDADIRCRLRSLAILAQACTGYVSHRDELARTRQLVDEADAALSAASAAPARWSESTVDLAEWSEHTTAVVRAYRELTW